MASGAIASWQVEEEEGEAVTEVEAVTDFLFLGSKMTAALKLKDTYFLEGKLLPTSIAY